MKKANLGELIVVMKKNPRKYLILIFIPLVIIALALWIASRWDVWFGNHPEPPYSALHEPSRVLMTYSEDGQSVQLSWQHDTIPHQSVVEYADVSSSHNDLLYRSEVRYTVFNSRSGQTVFYRTEMKNVKDGNDYKYRICTAKDTTQWYYFSLPNTDNHFSFIFFGDVQDEVSGGFDTLFSQVMNRNTNRAFVLFGGDLIERPMDKYWGEVFRSFDTLSATCPILAIPGNHEYLKGLTRRLEARFPLVFPYFGDSLPIKEYGVAQNSVYTFAKGDARFFFLDSNRDFGNYFSQRRWLKEELEKSRERWKFVALHHPIHSTKGFFNGVMVRLFFEDVIEEHHVDVVLQGHEHVYARSLLLENGKLTTPLYLVSYSSQKDYPMKFYGDVNKWGTADRYYQKFEVSSDSLVLNTYRSNHELYDKVVLKKSCFGDVEVEDQGKNIPQLIEVSEWFRTNKREKRIKEFEKSIQEWKQRQ
jgi:predicted phosphohydrolase